MIFHETELNGAFIVDLERKQDDRGYFARSWCQREFEAIGLDARLVQCSISHNLRRGTLRGMHYQLAPFEETKLVACPRGAVYDVIVDIRPASPTFKRWLAVELNEENGRSIYVPAGIAHGFQTLRDDSLVSYQMSDFFQPEMARGVRYDDPVLAIEWPISDPIVSKRDRELPSLCP